MLAIIVPLPEEDLAFLHAHGTSAEEFLAQQARNLRLYLQNWVGPEVTAASGIITPEVDGETLYRQHLEDKHA